MVNRRKYGLPVFLLFPVGNLSASTVSRQEMRTPIWVPLVDPGVPDHKLTQNFYNFYFSQKISQNIFTLSAHESGSLVSSHCGNLLPSV